MDLDGGATGLYVENSKGASDGTGASVAESARVTASNLKFDGCVRPVFMQPFCDVNITDSDFRDFDVPVDVGHGSHFEFKNMKTDFIDNAYSGTEVILVSQSRSLPARI